MLLSLGLQQRELVLGHASSRDESKAYKVDSLDGKDGACRERRVEIEKPFPILGCVVDHASVLKEIWSTAANHP